MKRLRAFTVGIVVPLAVLVFWQIVGSQPDMAGIVPPPLAVLQGWHGWVFGASGMGLNPYSGTWLSNVQYSSMRVAQVELDVKPGEFIALLGPSGCGKSTLLNLIAGFEKASGGSLTVDGAGVDKPGPDRGVVFQDAALFPWLTVWENVIFGPKTQGQPASSYEGRANEMLDIVGLSDFKRHLPVQLSGGMRQRVGIARILTMGSKVLLMDEPFGALDAQTRLSMQELLLTVWEQLKPTIVFVTHDIDEALFLADTVYVMSARPGRIQARITVPIVRPRTIEDTTTESFNAMKREILKQIRH